MTLHSYLNLNPAYTLTASKIVTNILTPPLQPKCARTFPLRFGFVWHFPVRRPCAPGVAGEDVLLPAARVICCRPETFQWIVSANSVI